MMLSRRLLATFAACMMIAALAGCTAPPKVDPSSQQALDALYADARDDMSSGSFERAAKTLEVIENRAAGTLMSQQAQLDRAYAYWRMQDRAQAQTVLDRFIRLNPSSPALDYALYLRGVINFNDNLGILGSLSRQSLSERDQQASRESYQSFKQLTEQFPNSTYANEARVRMDYIVNSLADYEVHVARYYLSRGAHVAAVNRAQQAVTDYPGSPAAEEALYILRSSYDELGLSQLRDDTDRVLRTNFPNSRFLADGSVRDPSKPWWQVW